MPCCSAAWLCDLGLIGVLRSCSAAPSARTGAQREQFTERERGALRNHHPVIYSQTLAALVDPSAEVGETITRRSTAKTFERQRLSRWHGGRRHPLGRPAARRCAVGFAESGLPKQAAVDAILAESGRAYDPEAVRLFLKVTHLVNLPRQGGGEILLEELEPGMMLASGIYSPHGLLLVGSKARRSGSAIIAKIRSHNEGDADQPAAPSSLMPYS